MSLPHDTLIELMSFADGELEGDAKARVEKLVAESDEARRALEGFQAPHVGLWLTEALDRRATAAGADTIAEAVMGRLPGEAHEPREVREAPVAPAVKIGDAAAKRAVPRGGPRRGVFVAAALGVTAIAAGLALFIRSSARPGSAQMPVASVDLPSVDMQKPPSEPAGVGVEVDDIDSPSRGISVFEIPLSQLAGASAKVAPRTGSSVVVWIDDEGPK